MDEITVRYTGNRYAGKLDDGTKALPPGVTQFEATGPARVFHFTLGHVQVLDREAVTIKEYQIL